MSPSMRASSRQHEYDMFRKDPPTSPYLKHLFPNLYTEDLDQHIQEVKDKEDKAILQEFERRQEESAKNEILQASNLIRNYCLTNKKTLADFLYEFKEHTRKCHLQHNVFNVTFYIRRKAINCELRNNVGVPMNSISQAFGVDVFSNNEDKVDNGDQTKQPSNINSSTKRITILTNEFRKNVNSDRISNK